MANTKPSIVVSDLDSSRLTDLALAAQARVPDVTGELLAEIERARIVSAASIPPTVVQMGSTVEYQSATGRRRVTLVFPGEADIDAGRISILTPIGTALIGLSPGQSITWRTRDGREHELTVLAVEPPSDGFPDDDEPGPMAA
jgi:regulator of nucleoside diphosphate kinase